MASTHMLTRLKPNIASIIYERFVKSFLVTSIPFGIIMSLIFAFNSDWSLAVYTGLIGGVFFGLAMAFFSNSQWVEDSSRPEIPIDEQIIKDGQASHFKGFENVGGWLFLTDSRLISKSHSFNFQNHELSIPLNEVVDAQSVLTMKIIPNGLRVEMCGGQSESFVVEGRREWSCQITELLSENKL